MPYGRYWLIRDKTNRFVEIYVDPDIYRIQPAPDQPWMSLREYVKAYPHGDVQVEAVDVDIPD